MAPNPSLFSNSFFESDFYCFNPLMIKHTQTQLCIKLGQSLRERLIIVQPIKTNVFITETSQLICRENQLTGFCIMETMVVSSLKVFCFTVR